MVRSKKTAGIDGNAAVREPSSPATDSLAILGDLARALATHHEIAPAAALCLRAICKAGPWSNGRFDLTHVASENTDTPPILIQHDADPTAVDHPVRENLNAVSFDIAGDGIAKLTLYRAGSLDIDPGADVVIRVAATLLKGVIERAQRLAERNRAEADRVHKWTLLKQSEDALREQYARLYTAINNISQGLAMYDGDGQIVLCNDLYASMYGLISTEVRPGTHVARIANSRRARGFEIADLVEAGAFETDGALALKTESRTWRLGDGRRILVSVQPLWNGGWVTTHEDTTERERFEERISHLAHHDALTDLANRVLFRQRLDQALALTAQGGAGVAVLWLDLDRFKIINDTMGHITGDLVLKAVAKRLVGCVRDTDLVARLGGDEFAILQVPAMGFADVDTLARRVREVIAAPFQIEGQRIMLGTSIGICIAPDDTDDADQMLLNADIALYRAKAEGRSAHRFFKRGMDAEIQTRRQLEVDLRNALDDQAFEIHYQPIIDLDTGAIVTCEALLRWHHPRLGPISPVDFIPLAEEAGLMVRLGHWVLARACKDAASWPNAAAVAVNVSPSHVMSQQLTIGIVQALERSGLRPDRLEVEITEAVMMQHTEAALQVLTDLRARGIKLAMDDFGTGYSSLAYIGRFPFSKIKIDRSFIVGLPEDRSSHAIVRAITGLSDGLGVITTAEGVETEGQLAAVLALGCTQVQGYLISKPVTNDALLRLFADHDASAIGRQGQSGRQRDGGVAVDRRAS